MLLGCRSESLEASGRLGGEMSTNATHNYRKINYGDFIMAEGQLPHWAWDPGRWAITATVITNYGARRYMWPIDDDGCVVGWVNRPTSEQWEEARVWMVEVLGSDSSVEYPKVEKGRLE